MNVRTSRRWAWAARTPNPCLGSARGYPGSYPQMRKLNPTYHEGGLPKATVVMGDKADIHMDVPYFPYFPT